MYRAQNYDRDYMDRCVIYNDTTFSILDYNNQLEDIPADLYNLSAWFIISLSEDKNDCICCHGCILLYCRRHGLGVHPAKEEVEIIHYKAELRTFNCL